MTIHYLTLNVEHTLNEKVISQTVIFSWDPKIAPLLKHLKEYYKNYFGNSTILYPPAEYILKFEDPRSNHSIRVIPLEQITKNQAIYMKNSGVTLVYSPLFPPEKSIEFLTNGRSSIIISYDKKKYGKTISLSTHKPNGETNDIVIMTPYKATKIAKELLEAVETLEK